MSSLVNANVWIYFTRSDFNDIVICKICKKSVKSKRNYNLRLHLKHKHKIELRMDKKVSHIKQQQLPTCSEEVHTDKKFYHTKHQQLPTCSKEVMMIKGINFWSYFTKIEGVERVNCKMCSKSLKSNHGCNLRSHLRKTHNIEIRLDKRVSQKYKQNKTGPLTYRNYENSSLESAPSRNSTADIQTLDSNGSYSRAPANPDIIDIKEEFIQDFLEKDGLYAVEQDISLETNSRGKDDNEEPTLTPNIPHLYRVKPIFVEPESIARENRNGFEDQLKSSNEFSSSSEFQPCFKRKTIIDDQIIIDVKGASLDPIEKDCTNNVEQEISLETNNRETRKPNIFVQPTARENRNGLDDSSSPTKNNIANDKPSSSNSNEDFEQWVKKKKQLLEIEEFEMRNYKIKLELWERERQLNLISSKFTKNIKIFKN